MMNAKEYLRNISRMEKGILTKKERLSVLREMAQSIGSPAMSDMPKNPNRNGPDMEDAILKMMGLEDEIRHDERCLKDAKTHALELVGQLQDPDYQMILLARYFRNEPWRRITERTRYSERWVYHLHRNALKALDEILKKEAT